MWYDWMVGGWGGRNGKDGSNATAPVFGVGLAVQPLEGQEVLSPILTTGHEFVMDSGGPGRHRGGLGVEKGAVVLEASDATVSYVCDRARSITWGLSGGLPSIPHGVWLNKGASDEEFLGAMFATRKVRPGDQLTRPSAGGGGYGDPLEREPERVCDDVADGYVSIERALKDYGVVVEAVDEELATYAVDWSATQEARDSIRASRDEWLSIDPEQVAVRYRAGEIDALDAIRQFGVILDWGTGELLARTTATFRDEVFRRSSRHWIPPDPSR
jgi:N-methylhydantoinase B